MRHPFVSERRASVFSLALFLIGLSILAYTHTWWPGILFVAGLCLALRQGLLHRFYDMGLSLFIFIGVFFTAHLEWSWEIVFPIIFITSALFILGREFLEKNLESEAEREEDLNQEIEEDENDEKL